MVAHQAVADEQAAQAGHDKAAAVLLGAMQQLYGLLSQQNQALADANERLEAQVAERTRSLLQAEKMAAVGQLAAGVAHEINNPIGFVNSNLGCGIPADQLGRLFEPFYTTQPIGTGTGLGLALSWDIIVNKHQGRIDVRSEPGQGSCFTVWLPRKAG